MKLVLKIVVSLSLLITVAITNLQATTLAVNSLGELEVRDAQSQLVTILSNGTISKTVKADNQAFKISYGKDLKNRLTSIIYPDPDKPQNISLNIYGQDVQISSDAVLTIVADSDMSMVTMQSGILGKVTVAGSELGRSSSVQVKNGSVVSYIPPPAAPLNVMPPATASKSTTATSDISSFNLTDMSSTPTNYEGGTARRVEGDVMIAPAGVDVVDAVRSSPVPPRLSEGKSITPGSTIQTGPTGIAFISPFPGAVVVVEPNSIVKFEELEATPGNRKMVANVKQGSIVSIIKGINPSELDFRVKTPHGVAAARGTIYSVTNNGPNSTAVVSDGVVKVTSYEQNPSLTSVTEETLIEDYFPRSSLAYIEHFAKLRQVTIGQNVVNVVAGTELTYAGGTTKEADPDRNARNLDAANRAKSFLGTGGPGGSSVTPQGPILPNLPPTTSPDLTPAPMTPVGP